MTEPTEICNTIVYEGYILDSEGNVSKRFFNSREEALQSLEEIHRFFVEQIRKNYYLKI